LATTKKRKFSAYKREKLINLIKGHKNPGPEDIKSISLGAIWNFSKVTGLPKFDMGHKGSVVKA
jgi:hypothetical protein